MIRINVDKVEYMEDFVHDGERYIEIRYESWHFLRYWTKETCSIDSDIKFCKLSIEELDDIAKFFKPVVMDKRTRDENNKIWWWYKHVPKESELIWWYWVPCDVHIKTPPRN